MTIDSRLSRALAVAFPESTDVLTEWLSSGNTASVSADAAERARQAIGSKATVDDVMLRLIHVARALAWTPTSGFPVGANWETHGESLALSMHAEQAAVAAAMMRDERGVTLLTVSSSPCGMCRQFLCELVDGPALPVHVQGRQPTSLAALLPDAFDAAALNGAAHLLAHPSVSLKAADTDGDPLVAAATRAASRSYAPYTRAFSGVAVETTDGYVAAGSYLESAAYNPSLAPVLVALAELRHAGKDPVDVARAVLVEAAGARITQARLTTAVLAAVSPAAVVRHVLALDDSVR
jgi:cytidine deaminase